MRTAAPSKDLAAMVTSPGVRIELLTILSSPQPASNMAKNSKASLSLCKWNWRGIPTAINRYPRFRGEEQHEPHEPPAAAGAKSAA